MAKKYPISITVVRQEGECGAGHKVGDHWVTEGKTPEGLCISALTAFWSHARVLMHDGTFAWQTEPDVLQVACPEAGFPFIFEIRRLRQ